jgi:thioredoxin
MTTAKQPAPPAPVLASVADVNAALDEARQNGPVLLLAWQDKAPRREVELALAEAAQHYKPRLKAYIIDARHQPELAEKLSLGSNPVLIGWYDGEARIKRSKPWGSDVTGIAADLMALVPVTEDEAPAEDGDQALADNKPIHVTDETFIQVVMESPLPVIVDFWADWCQPCKAIAPVLERLAAEYAGRIRIAKVDVEANPILSAQFQIRSIPTLMFVKGGQIVGQSAGAAPESALRDVIEQLIALQL